MFESILRWWSSYGIEFVRFLDVIALVDLQFDLIVSWTTILAEQLNEKEPVNVRNVQRAIERKPTKSKLTDSV